MTPETRSAVRSFQRRERLPLSGIVGPDTEEALKRACARASSASSDPGRAQRELTVEAEEEGLGDFFGRVAAGVGSAYGKVMDVVGSATRSRIIDLTGKADKSVRKGSRDPKTVYALVLHQMACCFKPKNPLSRFLSLKAHFAILADGRILQLHPISALIWASNGFNRRSVAVEFAGNFPNTADKWWKGDTYGRNRLTQAQVDAGRYLVRYLMRTMGLTHVLAHRQSSGTRENDPGPDIWYHVGQWAVGKLGLKDGGSGFKIGSGNPIPDAWRSWGRAPVSPEFGLEAEAESPETELAHDVWEAETDVSEHAGVQELAAQEVRDSISDAEVAAAVRDALKQPLPGGVHPQYRYIGPLPQAIDKAAGPGLYLIVFNSEGQRKMYSGKAQDLKKRLMQHRLCAQMLGLSVNSHRVFTASIPLSHLRATEKTINAHLRQKHRAVITNQRSELERGLLGEAWD
jgi:hypothetical protein